jgi:predicted Zn-dependent protease with MMP-like domain
MFRTRAQIFDDLVLEAAEAIEEHLGHPLESLEFAVEDVPPPLATYDSTVLEDGEVPLARVMPSTSTKNPARVVIYRWPLEARAHSRVELTELITEVVAEQVANLLGMDPEDLGS